MAKRALHDAMERYSAKLLFQFRVVRGGAKRLICEERIVHFEAQDPKSALTCAKAYGKQANNDWKNDDGRTVRFEFVGIIDMCRIIADDPREVWYDIREIVEPMRRKKRVTRSDTQLLQRMR